MGASMVKNCFGSESMPSPADRYRVTQPAPTHFHAHRRAHIQQQHPHYQQQRANNNYPIQPTTTQPKPTPPARQQLPHRPCHPAHALDNYHATAHSLRKPSPYDRFRQELQMRSAALPFLRRRERYDSRESTCSSSSSMTDDELHAILSRGEYPYYNHAYDKDRSSRRSSSKRSPVRSYASTAASEDSFYRSAETSRSYNSGVATPASSTNSNSTRRARISSPSFGFEDLLPECYVLEELIGSGTTSKCYRCRRTTDGRAFACKIINKRRLAFDQYQREEMAHQLRQEVHILRRLDHPNIAKLEDSFENDTYILLMMELLDGGELFETIIDRVRLTEADAKHTARSILSAISYMHSQGIVHRDIKPENLLLATQAAPGKPLHVKIVDFGFASSIESRGTMKSFLGTGGYLAPEVLTHQPYTAAVDTWAFGVLLYLMLCGRLPFTTAIQLQPGKRLSSVYRLTFPEKYWRGVSSPARDLLSKLLVVNPSQRLTPAEALKHRWFHSD